MGVHAYALMTNHIHILATPHDKDSITRIMQYLGRHYVPYINHPYGTSGSIWEGRYKASLIHDEEYLQTCVRYIELNPGRVDMVRTPSQYRWSSYRCNGQGKEDNLITHHQLYKALGRSQEDRLEAYKGLYKDHLENGVNRNIRSSLQTGTPLGDDYFRQKIEDKLQCKVGHARRGRPMKPKDGDFLE